MVNKYFKKLNTGVTLIELLVVLGIVAMVSSILMFNYSDFSNSVSIRNLSQEVALYIRKSQSFATSVQGVTISDGGERNYPAYGVTFSLEQTSNVVYPNSKRFISFVDIVPIGETIPNKKYDTSGLVCNEIGEGDECLETISINSADSLTKLETDVTGLIDSGTVVISFRRPSPDAIICYIPSGQTECVSQSPSYVKLYFQSSKGLTKVVSVWSTGQINVE